MGDHREKLALGLVELAQPPGRVRDLALELLREAPLLERQPGIVDGQRQVQRHFPRQAAGPRAQIAGALDRQHAETGGAGIERHDDSPGGPRPTGRAWAQADVALEVGDQGRRARLESPACD